MTLERQLFQPALRKQSEYLVQNQHLNKEGSPSTSVCHRVQDQHLNKQCSPNKSGTVSEPSMSTKIKGRDAFLCFFKNCI